MQLHLNLLITDNGAHKQLGIHQPANQNALEFFFNLNLARIHVAQIGNHGENVERNANGQNGGGILNGETDGIQAINDRAVKAHQHAMFNHDAHHAQEKVQIFEHTKNQQVNGNRQCNAPFITRTDSLTQDIIDIGNTDHEDQINRLTHGIEQHTDTQQREIFTAHIRHQKIYQHGQRKKNKQIVKVRKFHYRTPYRLT